MEKQNLFANIIRNEDEIEQETEEEPIIDVPIPKQPKKNGFWFKKGDLLPKLPKKRFISLKTGIFIAVIILLFIFCISLMAANSSLVENNQANTTLLNNQLNTCETTRKALELNENKLRTQITECNNQQIPIVQQKKCTVSDCSIYINTYNLTDNPTYIQSLKSEIAYLENLTYECLNVNSSINYTIQGYLKECRDELKEIKRILED